MEAEDADSEQNCKNVALHEMEKILINTELKRFATLPDGEKASFQMDD
jgi:hypothetical protein